MFPGLFEQKMQIGAFGSGIFQLLEPDVHNDLAAIMGICLIESGAQEARAHWQQAQLKNVMDHAQHHSDFWHNRLGGKGRMDWSRIPVLTRGLLQQQVAQEGSLTPQYAREAGSTYASSGSTGIPVQVHVCPQNGRYNELRSLAQYLIEGRPLHTNQTFIKPASPLDETALQQGVRVEQREGWLGSLGQLFVGGRYTIIHFAGNPEALVAALAHDEVGYLACLGSHMDLILRHCSPAMFQALGIHMWLHHSDNQDADRNHRLATLGVPVRSNYSCAELGPIGVSCPVDPDRYHVVESNVLVETDPNNTLDVAGRTLESLVITHLHGYATPLIRYEVGDFGQLFPQCSCGHRGASLAHIHGRSKCCLKKEDGSWLPFNVFSAHLSEVVSFSEYCIAQLDAHTLEVILGGRTHVSATEEKKLTAYLHSLSDPSFKVLIKPVIAIDWRNNPKRLPFVNYVR